MDGNRPKWMNMDEYEWYGWKWMNMDETGIIWNHILHNSYAAQISKQLLTSTELLGSQRLISASRPGNQHFLSRERFINFFPFQGNYMTCPVPLIWKPIGTTAMNHSAWNWSPHPVSAMRNMPNKNCPEGKCPWREMSQQRPPLASCSIASHCREHYELLACVTGISASHHITDYYWSLQDHLAASEIHWSLVVACYGHTLLQKKGIRITTLLFPLRCTKAQLCHSHSQIGVGQQREPNSKTKLTAASSWNKRTQNPACSLRLDFRSSLVLCFLF